MARRHIYPIRIYIGGRLILDAHSQDELKQAKETIDTALFMETLDDQELDQFIKIVEQKQIEDMRKLN